MSRQSKAAKNKKIAQGFSATRKSGGHGPEKTTPKHGKRQTQFEPGSRLYEAREKKLGEIVTKLRLGESFHRIQVGG